MPVGKHQIVGEALAPGAVATHVTERHSRPAQVDNARSAPGASDALTTRLRPPLLAA
jgi:hypothetical protein